MRAKELMDKSFVYLNCEDNVIEVSKVMEEIRRFTCPVVNDNKQLVGWITSFDITRGLREGNEKISEIMSGYEEVATGGRWKVRRLCRVRHGRARENFKIIIELFKIICYYYGRGIFSPLCQKAFSEVRYAG